MNLNKGKNVLVVDDCEDNLLLMELLLQNEGYAIESANSGRKGLAKFDEQQPDIIILDLMMPDISGLEFVRQLKDKYDISRIRIILLTANTNISHKDVKDIDAVCYKPFDIYKILDKIHSLLAVRLTI